MDGPASSSGVAAVAQQITAQRRIPNATYRLQLNRKLGFRDIAELLPYLDDLGISDLYLSPIFQACSGSDHGYDICDHNRVNSELGEEPELNELRAELAKRGMGIVLDVVPNHMGIRDACNIWWMDVLENGPSSVYAHYFDIDWKPVKRELRNKVLLPILEDQYGTTLENGKLRLVFESGSFFIRYYETILPVAPRTYSEILGHRLNMLSRLLGAEHPYFQELQSILTALSYLPLRTESDPGKVAERGREKEVIKRRIAALYKESPEVRSAIDSAVQEFNGTVGNARSFDNLDALLDKQVYRTAFWKVAAEEINYRRFFDINDLAAIRMEDPEVFRISHELLLRLLADRTVTGLRVDHADGLRDPAAYLRQMQYSYLCRCAERKPAGIPAHDLDAELSEWFATKFGGGFSEPRPCWPLYIVAEKILSEGEPLPLSWAADGTTGYDFLNANNGLFVDASREDEFTGIYAGFIGREIGFGTLVNSTKKMIMLVSLASEIYSLSHRLDEISEKNRRYRDFTLDSFTFGIREIIASLGIYRTYITGPGAVSQRDRDYIEAAVADAKRRNPRTPAALFDFIRDTLLLQNLSGFRKPDRPVLIDWVMRFQQITGPVMAKGVEDTAFYVFNRLLSLNEVGGNPGHFGITPAEFHRRNAERLRFWPHSMLASSTHDTKRSEDVRARLNVLSEMGKEWAKALARWRELNAGKKTRLEGDFAPDANDEYHFYQILLGIWPVNARRASDSLRERVSAYMQKTIKEAKVHTSWFNPNKGYDEAVGNFVTKALDDEVFLGEFLPFQRMIDGFGRYNALAQLLLKLTCPGVPDVYQGSELWDFRLVDPDNRRPVDYSVRRTLLAEVKSLAPDDLSRLASDLNASDGEGRIKLYVLFRTLNYRRERRDLFLQGDYTPLESVGSGSRHVCAFSRTLGTSRMIVAVPRLVAGLTGGKLRPPLGEAVWQDTRLIVPEKPAGRYRNIFTNELVAVGGENEPSATLSLASIFNRFPVALLERVSMS